jgi:site-specific DNA recombinase
MQRMLGSAEKYITPAEVSPERDELLRRAEMLAEQWWKSDCSTRDKFIRAMLKSVIVGQKSVSIQVDTETLIKNLLGPETPIADETHSHGTIVLNAKLQMTRGTQIRVFLPVHSHDDQKPVPSLIKAVARACDWYEKIISGEVTSLDHLAQQTQLSTAYIQRILRCALLSPKIMDAILSGRHRPHFTLTHVTSQMPLNWQQQAKSFGCEA